MNRNLTNKSIIRLKISNVFIAKLAMNILIKGQLHFSKITWHPIRTGHAIRTIWYILKFIFLYCCQYVQQFYINFKNKLKTDQQQIIILLKMLISR